MWMLGNVRNGGHGDDEGTSVPTPGETVLSG